MIHTVIRASSTLQKSVRADRLPWKVTQYGSIEGPFLIHERWIDIPYMQTLYDTMDPRRDCNMYLSA